MAATANPYGLYVRKSAGGRRNTAGNTHFPIPANVTGTMFYGAPVAFSATGGVVPMAASPASATPTCGVVQGAQWIEAGGKPRWFPSLPGGTFAGGGTKIEVMVNDDPSLVMMIQANGTLDLTAVGKAAAMVNFATGNANTGRCTGALDTASIAAGVVDKAFRIVGVLDPGAAFPDCLVMWNSGVHAEQAIAQFELTDPKAVDPEKQMQDFIEQQRERIDDIRVDAGLPTLEEEEEKLKQRREEKEKLREERHKKLEESRKHREAQRHAPPPQTAKPPVNHGKEK